VVFQCFKSAWSSRGLRPFVNKSKTKYAGHTDAETLTLLLFFFFLNSLHLGIFFYVYVYQKV
jgi:hypothetical protein